MQELNFRFYLGKYFLDDWVLIRLTGEDRKRFLDGQTTANLKMWNADHAILTARLDRTGRIQSYFYVITLNHEDFILSPEPLASKIVADLEKFVIMDDVSFQITNHKIWLVLGIPDHNLSPGVKISIFGEEAFASLSEPNDSRMKTITRNQIQLLSIINGWPEWDRDGLENKLLNETRLNELAIDYKKGCFLGQETVAKIQNNRGAAYFPSLIELTQNPGFIGRGDIFIGDEKIGYATDSIELSSNSYLRVVLNRKYRVENFEIKFLLNHQEYRGLVKSFPLLKSGSLNAKAQELYELASEAFQAGFEESAIEYLELALRANPAHADTYESLGVIYGRQGNYPAAIELMDKLESIDPTSVMAHTNKSLYLMKLGKIEQAEEEKAKATLKSFEMYGREADAKKQKAQQEKQKDQERRQREVMFHQVLEIDENDEIANFGLADIFFQENKIDLAMERLKRVLEHHPKYTQAYLLLGKCLELQKQKDSALATYKKGIEVATSKGELMPANEMQSRLRALI